MEKQGRDTDTDTERHCFGNEAWVGVGTWGFKKKKRCYKRVGSGAADAKSKAQKALCLGWTADAPCPHLSLTICSRAVGPRKGAFVTSVP